MTTKTSGVGPQMMASAARSIELCGRPCQGPGSFAVITQADAKPKANGVKNAIGQDTANAVLLGKWRPDIMYAIAPPQIIVVPAIIQYHGLNMCDLT